MLKWFAARLEQRARMMLWDFPGVRAMEQTDDVLQNATMRLINALRALSEEDDGPLSKPGMFHGADFMRLATLMIRRELLDLAKHIGRHPARVPAVGGDREGVEDQPQPANSTWSPDRLVDWTSFHEAVADLPDPAREVFELIWYAGLDQGDVATLLDVNVRTVKTPWREARLRLVEIFEGRLPGS